MLANLIPPHQALPAVSGLVSRHGPGRAVLVALLLAALLLSNPARAGDDEHMGPGLKVLELFTSHGCSSCPPADAMLARVAEQSDSALLLEFHVDYWDDLVHGRDGSFVDPFSDADWSRLQRAYNRLPLKGRPGVYTPQVIVNGNVALVGSDARALDKVLKHNPAPAHVPRLERAADGQIRYELAAAEEALPAGELWLYRFLDRTVTDVDGGENKGRQLENHNVVKAAERLGIWQGETLTGQFAAPAEGEGCVLVLRNLDGIGVTAASPCPE
ncbi:MAG: hypothetical protein CSB44_00465 [Gammaproteobacteria bacterium]|nr:MAG: hypothetical protein CSB44_00465 [Gammaproteobacteria bacterium]